MIRKWMRLPTCGLMILTVGSVWLSAQSMRPAPLVQRFGQWPQGGIGLLGFEATLGNPVVKGEPYSAKVMMQHTETLENGTQIDLKNISTVSRDSQGRLRRELTLRAIGSYTAAGEPPQVIFINDPVAGLRYVLDPQRKIARRSRLPHFSRPFNGVRRMRRNGNGPTVTTMSLGSKTMDGIRVEGTQTTRTIPAGRIGNNKPIEIVTKRWYSPDLHINIETTIHDPLRGDTTLRLTNISRSEPNASLFEVPAGYVMQTGNPRTRRGGMLGRRKRP